MDEQIPSDRSLLAQVARGESRALEVLHSRHVSLAKALAFRVLRDAALAEDAAQEAFVALWRTADAYDPGKASVRSWICLLAHRRAVDLARREARRRLADGHAGEVDLDSYTAEDVVLLRFDRKRVRAALDRLSHRNRELLELSYYGGLTQTQLAKRFEIPLGTVKSRTSHALALLRVELA